MIKRRFYSIFQIIEDFFEFPKFIQSYFLTIYQSIILKEVNQSVIMSNEANQEDINIYIRLPDQTGDILTISPKISVLELIDLIRQTQDLQTEVFDLYLRQQKMSQLFKTVNQYQIQDQDKIIVKFNSFFDRNPLTDYFLVLNFNNREYQLICDPRKKVYEMLIDFFDKFPQDQKLDEEDYVCYYNRMKLQLLKQLECYQIQSGSIVTLKKQTIKVSEEGIKKLNGSCKIAQSFYLEKQPLSTSEQIKEKASKTNRVDSLKSAKLIFSGFVQQDDSQDEVSLSPKSNLKIKHIKNPESPSKINFDPVSPIVFKMENSQSSPFCAVVSSFTDATKKADSLMRQLQIKEIQNSGFINSMSNIQQEYQIGTSSQNKQRIIQNKMVESEYLKQAVIQQKADSDYFSQNQSEQFIDDNLQELQIVDQSHQPNEQKDKTKFDQIYLTESFVAQDISSIQHKDLLLNRKKYTLTLKNQSTGRDYKITFLQKNTIKDIKAIIAVCQKVDQKCIRLINSANNQQYGNQDNFKDILTSNIGHLQIQMNH